MVTATTLKKDCRWLLGLVFFIQHRPEVVRSVQSFLRLKPGTWQRLLCVRFAGLGFPTLVLQLDSARQFLISQPSPLCLLTLCGSAHLALEPLQADSQLPAADSKT